MSDSIGSVPGFRTPVPQDSGTERPVEARTPATVPSGNLEPSGSVAAALLRQAEATESGAATNRAASDAPDLASPRVTANSGAVDGAVVRLSSLSNNSVSVQQVAQVIHSVNLELRDAARQDRQNSRDAEQMALQGAADKIRDAANLQMLGTAISSGLGIAGAGVSAYGARSAQMKFDTQLTGVAPGARGPALGPQMQQARLPVAQQMAARTMAYGTAGGTATTEIGRMGGAGANIGAADKQAEKSEMEAEASKARSRADDETEFKSAYEKAIQDVLDKLAEIQRGQNETMRNIANAG